jgi:hypothetical protein
MIVSAGSDVITDWILCGNMRLQLCYLLAKCHKRKPGQMHMGKGSNSLLSNHLACVYGHQSPMLQDTAVHAAAHNTTTCTLLKCLPPATAKAA